MKKFIKKNGAKKEATAYWISFSDLMSGTLIVFILLFIFKLIDYNETMAEKERLIRQSVAEKQQVIEQMTDTREKIVSDLQKQFEQQNMDIQVDPKTGAISLSESILFDFGKSELKPEGKQLLQSFMPVYTDTLLKDENTKKNISQIIIEGHTDDESGENTDNSFIYNMKLSQDRAFSVSEYILGNNMQYPLKPELKKLITANGRSYSDSVLNEDGSINHEKSRRVEIKFRLREEETLQRIQDELEKGKASLGN